MVVTDRDQHKKVGIVCQPGSGHVGGGSLHVHAYQSDDFHIYSVRYSFLVIQLFIAVVLKHWIRIKPRNGRKMEGGGGHLHAYVIHMLYIYMYQSNDFVYM